MEKISIVGRKVLRFEGLEKQSEEVKVHLEGGVTLLVEVTQDCCNQGWLEDIMDYDDNMIGSTLLDIEAVWAEKGHDAPTSYCQESHTWSYLRFKFSTGILGMRWCGTSNGYYSETADVTLYKHGGSVLDGSGKMRAEFR